jgi:hypothetical protein
LKKQNFVNMSPGLEEWKKEALEQRERLIELERDLSFYKGLKYDEVVKTGHNYTMQTDSLTHYKNGMTLRDCKTRAKEHQTSNVEQIIILHDFLTSEPRLLEKMVQTVLPNGNGEFFRCKLDHIKNCVDILGHTLDTVKSSSEQMTKGEIMSKVYQKLNLRMQCEEEVSSCKVLNESKPSEIEQWCKENIEFSVGGVLELADLNTRRFGAEFSNNQEKGRFRKQVEIFLQRTGESVDGFDHRMKNTGGSKKWKGICLIN